MNLLIPSIRDIIRSKSLKYFLHIYNIRYCSYYNIAHLLIVLKVKVNIINFFQQLMHYLTMRFKVFKLNTISRIISMKKNI